MTISEQDAEALRTYFAAAAEGVARGTVRIQTGMGDLRPADEVKRLSARRHPIRRMAESLLQKIKIF